MGAIASQITSLTIVCSIVCSDADKRKHQRSASLAFCREFTGNRLIRRTNGQLRGKCFHLTTSSWIMLFINDILAQMHIVVYQWWYSVHDIINLQENTVSIILAFVLGYRCNPSTDDRWCRAMSVTLLLVAINAWANNCVAGKMRLLNASVSLLNDFMVVFVLSSSENTYVYASNQCPDWFQIWLLYQSEILCCPY